MSSSKMTLTRRSFLSGVTGATLAAPMAHRAWAADPVTINMLAWYGHAEPDVMRNRMSWRNSKPSTTSSSFRSIMPEATTCSP